MVHTVSNHATELSASDARLSSIEGWLQARLAAPALTADLRESLEHLSHVVRADRQKSHDYFLTVVMRTQANRWEQLKDALLCLQAQTVQSFHVVIMLHNVDDAAAESVNELVQSYPNSFSQRITLQRVTGGGRTRPLSESVSHIRGGYVAFFDDDDLLFADWVESFCDAAETSPGQVIRANVATQLSAAETWSDNSEGQRTVSLVRAEYAPKMDLWAHLERNHSPFMGVAFPASFFLLWGEQFDEELVVCEDWDVILRATTLLGVVSSPNITAIYRQWKHAKTSYTQHEVAEWRASETRVLDKLNSAPFFAPANSVETLQQAIQSERDIAAFLGGRLDSVLRSSTWRAMQPVRNTLNRARAMKRRLRGGSSDVP